METAAGVVRREGLRVFRRLREPAHFLQSLAKDPSMVGLFSPRNQWQKPVMKLKIDVVRALHRADLLQSNAGEEQQRAPGGQGPTYTLSEAGHGWWRRQMGDADPFQAQHRLMGEASIDEPGRGMVRRDLNLGESPLGWLRRRQGKNGVAYLTEAEAEAGEQLRRDYTLAQIDARTTLNWDGMLAHVDSSSAGSAGQGDRSVQALDAQKRVERALAEVGPGLADIVVETCCHLNGLEQSERTLGWPQRSAKLVLKIALTRLAHHYRLTGGTKARRGSYVWHANNKTGAPARDQSV
ncbi:MAG: hypothetical protein HEP70_00650 [Rhodobiaceae bacterium]|nr:hypothetical protein [Rhodobiaceae bacterium]